MHASRAVVLFPFPGLGLLLVPLALSYGALVTLDHDRSAEVRRIAKCSRVSGDAPDDTELGVWKNQRVGLVNWFEIPVVDVERAMAFYEYVFRVELERTIIDGHPMALFPWADEPGRASGALATGDSYVPSIDGTRVYFRVDDVEATLARALERGGSVLYPAADVGEQGVVAEFADTEGNRIALSGPR